MNIRVALLSIALFATGQLLYFRIFSFFEPHIDDFFFQITDLGGNWPTSFLFSSVLALMPVLVTQVWRFGPILSLSGKINSISTTLAVTMLAVFARNREVKTYFERVVRPALLSQNRLPMQYPINPINFVYYIIGGFLIGIVISFFLFREKNKSVKTFI